MNYSYIIEGLDRLGKSTLIEGIQQVEGFHTVIHYAKPKLLDFYVKQAQAEPDEDMKTVETANFMYQHDGFVSMFELLDSEVPLIFDRGHLGEAVYAPMYRNYNGDYVFNMEISFSCEKRTDVCLILLVEDFATSKHFVDDGQSLGTADKRQAEQDKFLTAFHRSIFPNKKVICVTDPITGAFRSKDEILKEALASE